MREERMDEQRAKQEQAEDERFASRQAEVMFEIDLHESIEREEGYAFSHTPRWEPDLDEEREWQA